MNNNLVSAELPSDDLQAVLSNLTNVREILSFLVGLTPARRRSLSRMGDKTRAFVHKAVELADQNPELMPRCLDVDEMRRDINLVESLYPIMLSLVQLQELVEDTYLLAGSEAYAAARMAYNSARANGKDAGLNTAVVDMGRRFGRGGRKKQADQKTDQS
ncbi:hypothetical protein [Leptolyngbya sp. FACHB-261]|uniref:hypothetical protein n=1 Tax=Leptolyngbya sp. FACHB-261 TaxID=2692806 RepID=UPI0016874254|nr:hypothetical protein [Leptolyngbya sp. FACHB-261]MBD2101381.1 hypothetical protein [Leptolyngbya sp. FACHB-261]